MVEGLAEAITPPEQQTYIGPREWAVRRRYFNAQPMVIPAPLHALYDDVSPKIVVEKGAQLGISEWAINRGVWVADLGYALRGNALYVLPGGEHVGDFVQARVNPAIQESPYLIGRIRSDGNTKDPDKVGLRRIGRGYTYFRTSGSRAGLRTVDADLLVLDEYDEMADWVLPMASHRLDSSRAGMIVILGTPTHPGIGVDEEYLRGDQRRYEVECLTCGTWQALDWERSVEVRGDVLIDVTATATLLCVECRVELAASVDRAWEVGDNGRWVAREPDHLYHSYHLSQLYRPDTDLVAIARSLLATSQEARREAMNQSLGLPYTEAGGRVSEAELLRTSRGPTLATLAATTGTYMGVDVGGRLHCYVGKMVNGLPTMIAAFEVDGFEALDVAMRRWNVQHCVVDAHPELHAAEAFKNRWRGRVWLCNYIEDRWPMAWTDTHSLTRTPGSELLRPLPIVDVKQQYRVNVDRTAIMDSVADMLRGQETMTYGWQPAIALAADAGSVPGFYAHLSAPERITKEMPRRPGTMRALWTEGSRPDHYFHSLVYSELARRIGDEGPRVPKFEWA